MDSTIVIERAPASDAVRRLAAHVFVYSLAWLGLLHVLFGERLARMMRDWPEGLPGRPYAAHIAGALIALLALQLLTGRHTRVAAALLSAVLLLPVVGMHVPRALPTGDFGDAWLNVLKWLALAAGPLVLAAARPAPAARLNRVIRAGAVAAPYLLSAFMIGSAVLHVRFGPFVARLIPAFIPWPIFWTYVAAVTLAAGGLGLLLAHTRRLAALGTAAMIFSWFVLVHTPRMLADPASPIGWSEMAESLAFAAMALLIAQRSERAAQPAVRNGFAAIRPSGSAHTDRKPHP